jgi:hypothetical protein
MNHGSMELMLHGYETGVRRRENPSPPTGLNDVRRWFLGLRITVVSG